MGEYHHLEHLFGPVYDAHSKKLILGSFPSVKSREQGFYYGHPQNRFWKVLSAVLACDEPRTTEEKRQMLLQHHIAVWDVIDSCDIIGSSDSSIRNAMPTDIPWLLTQTRIDRIYTNGKTAGNLYQKLLQGRTGMEAVVLPSTSPANAAWKLERLIEAYRNILL